MVRPTKPKAELRTPVSVSLNKAQRAMFKKKGGSTWLQGMLDRAIHDVASTKRMLAAIAKKKPTNKEAVRAVFPHSICVDEDAQVSASQRFQVVADCTQPTVVLAVGYTAQEAWKHASQKLGRTA